MQQTVRDRLREKQRRLQSMVLYPWNEEVRLWISETRELLNAYFRWDKHRLAHFERLTEEEPAWPSVTNADALAKNWGHPEHWELELCLRRAREIKAEIQKILEVAIACPEEVGDHHQTRTAGVVVQSGGMLLIKHGGTIVGDSYENKGVAGAMGPHASVHNNHFVQEAGASQSTEILSQEHAAVIVALAKALAAHEIEGLSFDERLSGAQHLNALAGTARSGTTPDEALGGWTSWLQSLGARANSVLTTLATIATVATPIARMLGFPG